MKADLMAHRRDLARGAQVVLGQDVVIGRRQQQEVRRSNAEAMLECRHLPSLRDGIVHVVAKDHERVRFGNIAERTDDTAALPDVLKQRAIAGVGVIHPQGSSRRAFSLAAFASGSDRNGWSVNTRIERRLRKSRKSSASAVASPSIVRAARSRWTRPLASAEAGPTATLMVGCWRTAPLA